MHIFNVKISTHNIDIPITHSMIKKTDGITFFATESSFPIKLELLTNTCLEIYVKIQMQISILFVFVIFARYYFF